MKKFSRLLTAIALVAGSSRHVSADLISEFQPNPVGTDPATSQIELSGTPGASFSGFLTFVNTDTTPDSTGQINSSDAVSGNYDANGLAVITLSNFENPSFSLVFSSAQPTADVDANDDGVLDDPTVFGTVFDSVSILDATGDTTNFATVLGGVEFSTPTEFELTFRDLSTGQFFGVENGDIVDVIGNTFTAADFDIDPLLTTFGGINPTLVQQIPEPSSLALLGLVGCAGFTRRRR